jgi:DNA processing protein
MQCAELAAWLRLTLTPGVGDIAARQLLAAFGLPQNIFCQSREALSQVVTAAQATALLKEPDKLSELVSATWTWLHTVDSETPAVLRKIVTLGDPAYPVSLLNMEDPPPLLYTLGSSDTVPDAARCLAIVGSRNPTPQGKDTARQFGRALNEAGFTIVSGLALGIDGAAHHGALEGAKADGSPTRIATIAVVGTGLDRVYPSRHLALARAIAQNGLVVSECPLGTPPLAHNFPRRNRIIAALSQGTLVVEAALQSGSLITAKLAAEQGKDVFAIPGSIHSVQSRGCHHLIRQGAKLVETAADIVEELKPASTLVNLKPESTSVIEASAGYHHASGVDPLLEAMGFSPVSLDVIQARTSLPTAQLQAALMTLELEGWLARLPGGLFQRLAKG